MDKAEIERTANEFAELARQYIEWLITFKERRGVFGNPAPLLLDLCQHMEKTPAVDSDEESDLDTESLDYCEIKELPFHHYWLVFDPTDQGDQEAITFDLADDLASVWNDLRLGLAYFEQGKTAEALWQWRFGYFSHWGHHALSASYALHCHFREER